jgi:tetratricopeptide (TPR) repeat protein
MDQAKVESAGLESADSIAGLTRVADADAAPADSAKGAAELGERVRRLRIAAGLSQTQLAAGRFSKEYVSQIERGKTRPTADTLVWLAERLGADPEFLALGVSSVERYRWEAALARGEALVEQRRYDEAVLELEASLGAARELGVAGLTVRALAALAWARMELGELQTAIQLLLDARGLAEGPSSSDVERADILFRLGVCRYKLSSVSTAEALLDEALQLADRSGHPCDRLRAEILLWRSRCYRRQRDYLAARENVERALELAESLNDPATAANAYFQASLVADREGHPGLARSYAERARSRYEEIADRAMVGRLLNNLGAFTYMLGRSEEAVGYLKDALRVLLDQGSDVEAAHVVCSLAEIHLGMGRYEDSESEARKALELLGDRVDYLSEIGTAQLALGRALMEQDRLDEAQEVLRGADRSFEQLGSAGHRASAWIALGDLATRRGDDRAAARLYRRAAEALQDVRF